MLYQTFIISNDLSFLYIRKQTLLGCSRLQSPEKYGWNMAQVSLNLIDFSVFIIKEKYF